MVSGFFVAGEERKVRLYFHPFHESAMKVSKIKITKVHVIKYNIYFEYPVLRAAISHVFIVEYNLQGLT
ncbi:hypothetical protein D3C73_1514400 [compost metagenome]